MNIIPEVAALDAEMRAWRHQIHAHPETAFEETQTAALVAEKLASFGLEVHTRHRGDRCGRRVAPWPGQGGRRHARRLGRAARSRKNRAWRTHRPTPARCTRADTTATPRCCSVPPVQWRNASGSTAPLTFIFQPAEENDGGGRVMVREGLFDRFPMKAVYGMHNWPPLPAGRMALRAGPLMGAYDIFEIVATGRGAHAAMPHLGRDPMPFAAHVINALQTIVSRNIDPMQAGVVSVTQVHGGDTWNVIPQEVVLRGTVRTFLPEVQDTIERRMGEIVAGIAATFEMTRDSPLRTPLSGDDQFARGSAARAGGRHRASRRGQRGHRSRSVDGLRGFRLHVAGQARVLCLAGRRTGTSDAEPA